VILAIAGPEDEREFRLGWSLWRRAHQAIAKRCHEASHATKHGPLPEERLLGLVQHVPTATRTSASTPMAACLTNEKWNLVEPFMPPQKPLTGRPRSDHRTMLAGVLWVFGTGAAGWQDLPQEEFGPWRTVYGHYRQWCEEGLWQRIVEMLQLWR
jgi:Putative transposase of IS4/5 family (DUF4096)